MSAIGGFLSVARNGGVELTAAGRVRAAERPAPPTTETDVVDTTVVPAGGGSGGAAPAVEPLPPADQSPTTTVEVPRRLPPNTGPTEPPTPPAAPPPPVAPLVAPLVAPADDPVVRLPSTPDPIAPSGPSAGAPAAPVSSANRGDPIRFASPEPATPAAATPAAAGPQAADPALVDCPAEEVRVTVVTDKAVYAPGEVISGSSTIENRSATACLLPTRGFFRINEPGGHSVSSFAYTAEFRNPVRAEPGKTFISGFTWDQQDCAATCVQVPTGSYTAFADWTEGGYYSGRASFQIGA